ncbi:MAG: hypothetical protein A2Y77_17330 [Planctomycetes bacterium RBG_13_62_9]|nr:MAG: hypothetical protein A2Y77_17330 [Planctomycetes bacterium RBG_13_62_9]
MIGAGAPISGLRIHAVELHREDIGGGTTPLQTELPLSPSMSALFQHLSVERHRHIPPVSSIVYSTPGLSEDQMLSLKNLSATEGLRMPGPRQLGQVLPSLPLCLRALRARESIQGVAIGWEEDLRKMRGKTDGKKPA